MPTSAESAVAVDALGTGKGSCGDVCSCPPAQCVACASPAVPSAAANTSGLSESLTRWPLVSGFEWFFPRQPGRNLLATSGGREGVFGDGSKATMHPKGVRYSTASSTRRATGAACRAITTRGRVSARRGRGSRMPPQRDAPPRRRLPGSGSDRGGRPRTRRRSAGGDPRGALGPRPAGRRAGPHS